MKANKTMRGWAVSNHRRRKDKQSESSMCSKVHIHSNTVVVGEFNTPLPQIVRSSKQKISKEILELNPTIDQMDQADVYRIFHPTSAQYTVFSPAHGTFSKLVIS
jgi:hypothetical protein